nr:hypothetical protein [Streptomyces antibioticus]
MKRKATAWVLPALLVAFGVVGSGAPSSAQNENRAAAASTTAVGPQYDTTHVYVTPGATDAFVASWEATFGGTHTAKVVTTVTPTPSRTESELVLSPVGTLSVFDFKTPAPYPFGTERTGWLMSDFDTGVRLARRSGAQVVVAPFDDPVGRDAIVQFPGGIDALAHQGSVVRATGDRAGQPRLSDAGFGARLPPLLPALHRRADRRRSAGGGRR